MNKKIFELWKQGIQLKNIARYFKVSQDTIKNIIRFEKSKVTKPLIYQTFSDIKDSKRIRKNNKKVLDFIL